MIKTDEIRARWSKVLPCPWRVVATNPVCAVSATSDGQFTIVSECRDETTVRAIAKAPEDIEYLLGEVDRLQRENADMYQRAYHPDARY